MLGRAEAAEKVTYNLGLTGRGGFWPAGRVGRGVHSEVVGRQRPWDRGSGARVTEGSTRSGLLTPWRAFHSWEVGWSAHPTPAPHPTPVREEKAGPSNEAIKPLLDVWFQERKGVRVIRGRKRPVLLWSSVWGILCPLMSLRGL